MTASGAIFSRPAAQRVVRAVRQVERMHPPGGGNPWADKPTWQFPHTVEGTLDGNLDAATSITGTKTATLSVYRYNSGGTFADTTENITVTNRNTNFSASSGDYLKAVYIAGEWRPLPGSSAGGAILFDVVQVNSTSHSITPTASTMLVCNTVVAGGAITVTVSLPSAATDGAELVVKNWESGTGSANVTVTQVNDYRDVDLNAGVEEQKVITPGNEARAILSQEAVTTKPIEFPKMAAGAVASWIWVS